MLLVATFTEVSSAPAEESSNAAAELALVLCEVRTVKGTILAAELAGFPGSAVGTDEFFWDLLLVAVVFAVLFATEIDTMTQVTLIIAEAVNHIAIALFVVIPI